MVDFWQQPESLLSEVLRHFITIFILCGAPRLFALTTRRVVHDKENFTLAHIETDHKLSNLPRHSPEDGWFDSRRKLETKIQNVNFDC